MTRTVALSQFMPYGAPDLIAAAPRHLSGAVMASSGLAVAAFSLLCLVVSLLPPSRTPEVPIDKIIDIGPPPLIPAPPAPARAAPPGARATPRAGVPIPMPDPATEQEIVAPPASPTRPLDDCCGSGVAGVPGVAEPQPATETPPSIYVDELPIPIVRPEPTYPDIAREAGVEGVVIVRALVDRSGRVAEAVVAPKFSIPLLDAAALEAARRWQFKPAYTNGRPVAVWVALPFRFTLR